MEKIKTLIEDFCYSLGFKVHFKRKPISFLIPTKDLNIQFQNLVKIKDELYQEHLREIKNKLHNQNFGYPNLILETNYQNQQIYSLIWQGNDRTVRISYSPNGELFYLSTHKTDPEAPYSFSRNLASVRREIYLTTLKSST